MPGPAAVPGHAVPAGVVQVDGTCVLPAEGPAVERGVLVARLHEYDPRLVDSQAREVGRTTVPGLSHRPGEKTSVRFAVAGRTTDAMAHYLTVAVYPEGAPAGQAGLYFLDGFRQVLADGNREALRITLTPVPEEGGPSN
ncbi:MAG: hypothetical protein AB7V14_02205 [Kiritimatiellia bacterium]